MNKALKKRERDTGWCSYVQAKEIRFPIHPYHFNTPQISKEITTVFGRGQSPLGSNQAVGGGAQLSRGSRESESATGHRREGAELATTPQPAGTTPGNRDSQALPDSKSQDQADAPLCPPHPKYFCASVVNLGAMGQSGKHPRMRRCEFDL